MPVTLDPVSQVLMRDGKAVRLSAMECAVMAQLLKPKPIEHIELRRRVRASGRSLHTAVCLLRKKIKRLGLKITHGLNIGGMRLVSIKT